MPKASETPSPGMPCIACQELIEAFVDGELAPMDRARLERHFEGCGECGAEVELARRIQGELRALPRFEAPPAVGEHSPSRSKAELLVLAAALLVAAIGASILLWGPPGRWSDEPAISARRAPGLESEALGRAELEARYALALMGDLTRRQSLAMRDEILIPRVLAPTTQALNRALAPLPEAGLALAPSPGGSGSGKQDRGGAGANPEKPS